MFVCSWIRILFNGADEDNFIDVIDGDHSIFSPDIINYVDGEEDDD